MDADEVLTGRKKKKQVVEEPLYSMLGKPSSEEILKEVFNKSSELPKINPRPFVKIVDVKGKDRKLHNGIEVGLEFSF